MKIEMQQNAKTFENGFDEFIRYCVVRDHAESSILNYRVTIEQFNRFFPPLTPIHQINDSTIEDFVLFLRENMAS